LRQAANNEPLVKIIVPQGQGAGEEEVQYYK
jgi:hypothetical protein